MIGERVYHKPKQWNVYQPDTFKLDKLLRGIGRFAVELNVKVHIKGFILPVILAHGIPWLRARAMPSMAIPLPATGRVCGHRQQCLAAV